ncbi:MAG: N-acetylmuramoyl-L-alanine amidase [Bacteroidales bacterium]|nr:N-acetylmuramoyl-L-alanine amidase [Bacteroidales bacterium]
MKLFVLLVLSFFQMAEQQCPSLPVGLLEAVSFTNTQCHHLTDADYSIPADDPAAMPRAYGMMGLVRDGKGCFRENLHTISALSGYSEEEILADPAINILAYAKACEKTALRLGVTSKSPEAWMPVIMELSELPLSEQRDELPMKMMLYSVYDHLGCDLKTLFGEDYALLSGEAISISKETDYPNAIWVPAPECNYEERTKEVSAVVIHYTEGSYAGCISWFQNCEASVSAHYVIRSYDGQVTQMVREKDKAWHARSANGYTIGVEHEAYGDIISFFTPEMYASSADLMRSICSRYEAINGYRTFCTDTLDNGTALDSGLHNLGGEGSCIQIRGHQHYPDQSHTDPGPYWNWNYYYKLINMDTPVMELGGPGVTEGVLNHEQYGDDERRIWVIRSDDNTIIDLDFTMFDLEPDYDFLWIYDGDNVFAPQLGRWNTTSPGSVRSSGNALCVEFRSDCATTAAGWQAQWRVGHMTQIDTIMVSPPQRSVLYPNPVGDRLHLLFHEPGYYDLAIFDLTGKQVYKGRVISEADIDVSHLSQGTYVVRYKRVKDGTVIEERFIR